VPAPDRWFTYSNWLDDARMPDFARTVDIPQHDKVVLRLGQHDPLPAAGPHERADGKTAHDTRLPNRPGWAAIMASQSPCAPVGRRR
jgi:hypothetical protein